MELAIGAQNLSKVFGNFRAVNQILDIKYGEVLGLWGRTVQVGEATIKTLPS